MLKVSIRRLFASNGLIDDIVIYGTPNDYKEFSAQVKAAVTSQSAVLCSAESGGELYIEISKDEKAEVLFTSLQNEKNEYFSLSDWSERKILRVTGSENLLKKLSKFLSDLSNKGEGYSYISEFCKEDKYSKLSPQWRLHVEKEQSCK